jgi:hypothetical protein
VGGQTRRFTPHPNLPPQKAYLAYFFGAHGFVTVDGIPILPPMHFGEMIPFDPVTLAGELDKVKGLLSEKTADRYVRDLIRVTVEAAEDARYGLRRRNASLLASVGEAKQAKAIRWFKGISSLAEALVTSAVDEVVLGIAQFETNALIAASAGDVCWHRGAKSGLACFPR